MPLGQGGERSDQAVVSGDQAAFIGTALPVGTIAVQHCATHPTGVGNIDAVDVLRRGTGKPRPGLAKAPTNGERNAGIIHGVTVVLGRLKECPGPRTTLGPQEGQLGCATSGLHRRN